MAEYHYQDFWRTVAAAYAADDALGAVCWDGAPPWLNRFFARFQVAAIEQAVLAELGDVHRRGRALDLGCGTGRWTRWLERWWSDPIGVDISPGMLAAGRPTRRSASGDITKLPFAAGAFDFTLSVTVLLHLPPDEQERAAEEIARVLKPGGRVVLLEMMHRTAPRAHVFPRDMAGWSALLRDAGFEITLTDGESYAPLLRLGFVAAGRVPARGTLSTIDRVKQRDDGKPALSAASIARLPGPARAGVRAAVAASYPIEYVARATMPPGWALNACIVARKR